MNGPNLRRATVRPDHTCSRSGVINARAPGCAEVLLQLRGACRRVSAGRWMGAGADGPSRRHAARVADGRSATGKPPESEARRRVDACALRALPNDSPGRVVLAERSSREGTMRVSTERLITHVIACAITHEVAHVIAHTPALTLVSADGRIPAARSHQVEPRRLDRVGAEGLDGSTQGLLELLVSQIGRGCHEAHQRSR